MKAAAAGLCILAATSAFGGEAVYRVFGDRAPAALAANGFLQQVEEVAPGEFEVHLTTSLAPIGASGSYARILKQNSPQVPEGFRVPASLSRLLSPDLEAWQAATAVLTWVMRHVRVDDDDLGPQDAGAVLRRGRGRCSGMANASVALLRAVGFEARTLSGVLVTDEEVIPHRWLECRLPGAGWVPTDPTLGLWTVTAGHLAYPDTVTEPPRVEVLARSADGLERLPRHAGRLLRPNDGAGLVCRLPAPVPEIAPVAVLRGSGGEVRRALLDPEARFSGLLPGRWVLEVEAQGSVVERHRLTLRSGELHALTLKALGAIPAAGSGS
jgi:hypothetical protein